MKFLLKWLFNPDWFTFYFGGGGGGTTQSTGTTYNTNIPEYAEPYVTTMLGATQKQLFNMDGNEITGFKPYTPYSSSPSDYVAPFSPMQQEAFRGAQNLGPSPLGEIGGQMAGAATMDALGTDYDPYQMGQFTSGRAAQYMNPFVEMAMEPQLREAQRASEMQRVADMGQATRAGAFGGGRQAIIEAERQRNLGTQMGDIRAKGLMTAFDQAQQNFAREQQMREQSRQYGAGLGIQGLQTALQGAGTMGQLGQTQFGQRQATLGTKQQFGAMQQAQEQQKINQAIQDFANTQQYPLMQLGVMSNMLRGLPMQAATTNQYVAAPNPITQGIGAAGTYASLQNAGVFGKPTGAAGGLPSEFKYAEGGIASVPRYDVGGEVESQLESMDTQNLVKQAQESSSPTVRRMAQRILRERQMEKTADQGTGPTGPMGIDYQAPQGMAGGGIVAFQSGERVTDPEREARLQQNTETGEMYDPGVRLQQNTESGNMYSPSGKGIAGATARSLAPPAAQAAPVVPAAPAAQAAPTAPAAQAAPAAPTYTGGLGDLQKMMVAAETQASRPVTGVGSYLEEIERNQPENAAAAEYRKQIMSERANSKDEAERQRHMRMAEFFARWGSTPGPTLAAGLKALEKSIPDIIGDEKEQKKARRELDKVQFDIDNSIRLEKLGNQKEARALSEKARDRFMQLNERYASSLTSRETAQIQADAHDRSSKLQAETSRYVAEQNLKGQQAVAAATRANREQQDIDRIQRAYLSAVANRQDEDRNIAKEMTDPAYVDAKKTLSYTPRTMTPALRQQRQEAQTLVNTREAGWKARREDADGLVTLYRNQALPAFEKRGVNTDGKETPAATPAAKPAASAASAPAKPAAPASAPAKPTAPASAAAAPPSKPAGFPAEAQWSDREGAWVIPRKGRGGVTNWVKLVPE